MARAHFSISLTDEQTAMLDGIRKDAKGTSRAELAKRLLVAVLEDDAVAHGAAPRVRAHGDVIIFPRSR